MLMEHHPWGAPPDASYLHPAPLLLAVPGNFSYISPLFKNTYVLNTNPMAFQQAELFCNENGGHLVSWESLQEQVNDSCCASTCFLHVKVQQLL